MASEHWNLFVKSWGLIWAFPYYSLDNYKLIPEELIYWKLSPLTIYIRLVEDGKGSVGRIH